jgi:GT2 family glycosyltransferase
MADAESDPVPAGDARPRQPERGEAERRDAVQERLTLTICVPTFSRPELVQRAIASIIESAKGFETSVEIIVSDNSPQISEGACREALAAWTGPSTYIGNEVDIGIAGNLNQCIARAGAPYVVFVHDDDRLLPQAVPAILRAIGEQGPDDNVLLMGVHIVDGAGNLIRRQEFCRDERIVPSDALERLLSDNGIAWFPGVVVSAEAYAAVGPFDAGVGNATDLEMWVRLFASYGVRCVPHSISAYTVHTGSATQTMAFDREAVSNLIGIFDRARRMKVLRSDTIDRSQAQFLHQVILGAAYAELRAGNRARARKVMTLFDLPTVRALAPPLEWLPARWISTMVVRSPSFLVRPLVAVVDRLDLVRRIRAVGVRGRGRMPFC